MQPIPKSGYYYANKVSLAALKAFEEVMGRNGLHAILNLAHLPHLVDNFPPDNLERELDFADFSAINWALEETYGLRGGRGLALNAGKAAFAEVLRNHGALAGVSHPAFQARPLESKLRIGIPAMAMVLSQVSDQQCTLQASENEYILSIQPCPVCWGRSGMDKPLCFITVGMLEDGLKWISGGEDFQVVETRCAAKGDAACDFTINKTPLSISISV